MRPFVLSLAALLGSCSGAPDDGRTVTVGMLPVADLVVLHLGKAKGFFAQEGLDVRFVEVPRGDAAVSALLSNSVNVANVDIVTGLVARQQNLPIQWVTTVHSSPPSKDVPFAGTFVRADSPIRTWADLNGRRVSTSCRKCGTEVYLRGAVDLNGGDSATIDLITMPTAQAVQALGQGQVDAVPVSPGLIPKAIAAGYRSIGDHIAETALGHQLGPIAVNTVWADTHPKLLKAFIRGVNRSAEYASSHPDEARAAIPAHYPQAAPDAAAAAKIPLAVWSSCFRFSAFRSLAALSYNYGFIRKPVTNIDSLFYTRHSIRPRSC
jgi:NitT/TauT family transport system substrate-binding protein